MRLRNTVVAGLVAAGALAAVAPGFAAADGSVATADPVIQCRQVTVGGSIVKICVEVGTRSQIGSNGSATVAPYVSITCPDGGTVFTCNGVSAGVNKTGFEKNSAYPSPTIDPASLTVYQPAGTLGTVWVNGSSFTLNTPEICFGDDIHCPGLIK